MINGNTIAKSGVFDLSQLSIRYITYICLAIGFMAILASAALYFLPDTVVRSFSPDGTLKEKHIQKFKDLAGLLDGMGIFFISFSILAFKKPYIIKALSRVLNHIPLWCYLFILGFFTFYTYKIAVSSDLGVYMVNALNILSGKGYVNMDDSLRLLRGPVFPLMIALSYRILGVSPWSAFWVIRIFAILSPIIVYSLGKRLYGRWVGFSAALLVLTSGSMNFISYRHLDAIWPFFVLLAVWFLSIGFERQRSLYFVFAALSMGVGYLTKEVCLVFFFLPVLFFFFIGQYRKKENLLGILLYFVFLIATIMPWLWYISVNSKPPIMGAVGEIVKYCVSTPGNLNSQAKFYLITRLKELLSPFHYYFYASPYSINAHFMLASVFLVSWLHCGYSAVKRNKSDIIIVLCLLSFIPLIYCIGTWGLRLGQSVIVLLLSYLVAANFLLKVSNWLGRKVRLSNVSIKYIGIILVIAAIIVQLPGDAKFVYNSSSLIGRPWFGPRSKKIKGYFSDDFREIGSWVEAHIEPGKRFMWFFPPEACSLYLYTGGKYEFIRVAIRYCGYRSLPIQKPPSEFPPLDDLILLTTGSRYITPKRRYLRLFYEPDLLSYIEENAVDYIVVGRVYEPLQLYFHNSPTFQEVFNSDKAKLRIFKVNSIDPYKDHKIYITRKSSEHLRSLKSEEGLIFNDLKTFMIENLRFSQEQFDCLVLGVDKGEIRFIK